MTGKGDRRGRRSGGGASRRRDRLDEFVPESSASRADNSRNGQFIRGGRSARTRLRPVRAESLSRERGRSTATSWLTILIVVVVITALVWFFFVRDANAVTGLLVIGGAHSPDRARTYNNGWFTREGW